MKRVLIAAALAVAGAAAPIGQAPAHAGNGGIGIGFGIGFGVSCWKPPCPQYCPPPPCCMPMGYGYGMPQQPCYGGNDGYGASAAPPAPAAASMAAGAPFGL